MPTFCRIWELNLDSQIWQNLALEFREIQITELSNILVSGRFKKPDRIGSDRIDKTQAGSDRINKTWIGLGPINKTRTGSEKNYHNIHVTAHDQVL